MKYVDLALSGYSEMISIWNFKWFWERSLVGNRKPTEPDLSNIETIIPNSQLNNNLSPVAASFTLIIDFKFLLSSMKGKHVYLIKTCLVVLVFNLIFQLSLSLALQTLVALKIVNYMYYVSKCRRAMVTVCSVRFSLTSTSL